MPAQPARNPTDSGPSTAQSSSQLNNVREKERNEGMTPWGESPDLLRWRADLLMDEMMLGAVDVYAGEPKVAAFSAVASVYSASAGNRSLDNAERPLPTSGTHRKPETPAATGAFTNRSSLINQDPMDRQLVDMPAPAMPLSAPEPAAYEKGRTEPAYGASSQSSSSSRSLSPSPNPPPNPLPNREPKAWVFSAEARYQRIARDQQAMNVDDTAPANFTSSVPLPPPAPRWMPEEAATLPANRVESPIASVGNSAQGPELGPVRRTTAQTASAMTMPTQNGAAYGGSNRNGKWSNLLPRMSNTDVQTLQQEITTLQSEINALLPSGHESNRRAQHLLEKAQTIVESDPARSAEVEYYLQQVRTIFQRVQQTIHWSNLYRNRLLVYLTGWSLLAIISLIARYLYEPQLGGLVADWAQWATDSFAAQNFTTWLSTIAAGALGGAVGALLHVRLRSHLEHGFFDRKYGLRGLILPIMGMLFGLLLYLLIGPLFYLLEIDPSINVVMSTLPSLLSFAFGLGQEFIYGTRG